MLRGIASGLILILLTSCGTPEYQNRCEKAGRIYFKIDDIDINHYVSACLDPNNPEITEIIKELRRNGAEDSD